MENYDSLLESACLGITGPKPLTDKVDTSSDFSSDWDSITKTRIICSYSNPLPSIHTTYIASISEGKLLKVLSAKREGIGSKLWTDYHSESLRSLLKDLVSPGEYVDNIIGIEVELDMLSLYRSVRIEFQTFRPGIGIGVHSA
jgi:hypothetical protein